MTELYQIQADIEYLNNIRHLDLLNFGLHDLVYIRETYHQGRKLFVIYSADGYPLGAHSSYTHALDILAAHDLYIATLQ